MNDDDTDQPTFEEDHPELNDPARTDYGTYKARRRDWERDKKQEEEQ